MHIYFSGIGGAGLSSLALMAKQAGLSVTGSDKQDNHNLHYLREMGVKNTHIGQSWDQIAEVHAKKPIDWLVYTSALPMEQPDADELRFCRENNIKATKRDVFLNYLLEKQGLKMLAIAGTHGKTTTTAMAIWLFKQLGTPISYSVAGNINFGKTAELNSDSEYFIYEADEFDRNFLAFRPHLSIITGIDWDHPDIYPTRASYYQAFRDFLGQSNQVVMWDGDAERLDLEASKNQLILDDEDAQIDERLHLAGHVNRLDAWLVAHAAHQITGKPLDELLPHLDTFPGVGRRFEQIIPNLITDYAHTAAKIRGALQAASEVAGDEVIVVYEGLHNTRQHFMKQDLKHLFDGIKKLYIVPSYLAREDPNLPLLSPKNLKELLNPVTQARTEPAELNGALRENIQKHLDSGELVLCITAGGGGSLDEWLRQNFSR
ncbi:MAG TPA: Mur ligase family protein [Candidatus Saccharimonadales bacterium]